MTKKSGQLKVAADKLVKSICRKTRQTYSLEEKICIVLAGLRGEETSRGLLRIPLSVSALWPFLVFPFPHAIICFLYADVHFPELNLCVLSGHNIVSLFFDPAAQCRKANTEVRCYLFAAQPTRQRNTHNFLSEFCRLFCSYIYSPLVHNMRLKERDNSARGPVAI